MRKNRRGGRRFRDLLAKHGFTPKDLAAALKVSRGIVSHWGLGKRQPSDEHLKAIAATLGCTVEDVLAIFTEE